MRRHMIPLILSAILLIACSCGKRQPEDLGTDPAAAAQAATAPAAAAQAATAPAAAAQAATDPAAAAQEATAQAAANPAATDAEEVHVAMNGSDESADGSQAAPYATAQAAAKAHPGALITVHGGDYGPVELSPECSGRAGSPTVIRAAEEETVVIHAGNGIGIRIVNASHLTIDGFKIEGGTHGIEYTSTREAGEQPLSGICIRNCTVSGVRGVHGICVYARNDLAPVTDLTIERCEISDCECGSSESLVLNGNIDGFLIAENKVHDNNNIGIDMIGVEGTAMHPGTDSAVNPYEQDFVRNGICRENLVYNISTEGNPAYYEEGEYDLCAGGIYVDGGQNIEICNNFVFNCDIGMEAATEHSPDENELFSVSGIMVHDNVIADCGGGAGLCFGGYDRDLGFTHKCEFHHNTLVDNDVQIGVQRSRDNRVFANLILGGETGVEFNEYCAREDMINEISGNLCAEIGDEDSWEEEYGAAYADRNEVADGFRPLATDCGSRFVPDNGMMAVYLEQKSR